MTEPATKKPRTASEAKLVQLGFLRQLTLIIRAVLFAALRAASPAARVPAVVLLVAIACRVPATLA